MLKIHTDNTSPYCATSSTSPTPSSCRGHFRYLVKQTALVQDIKKLALSTLKGLVIGLATGALTGLSFSIYCKVVNHLPFKYSIASPLIFGVGGACIGGLVQITKYVIGKFSSNVPTTKTVANIGLVSISSSKGQSITALVTPVAISETKFSS